MKKTSFINRLATVYSVVAISFLLCTQAQALTPDKVFAKVSPSIVEVLATNSALNKGKQGSGVVIKDERVITNCHVLTKMKYILVKWGEAKLFASLEYPDIERDLCEIKVPSLKAPAVAIAPEKSLRIGERVYAIGNPMGLELTLSEGLISSFRHDKGMRYIQTTADFTHGSSGGGLFDDQGRLVGITTLVHSDGNLNFAVPASYIKELAKRGAAELKKLRSGKQNTTKDKTVANSDNPSTTMPKHKLNGAEIAKIFVPGEKLHAEPNRSHPYTISIEGRESASRDCPLCHLDSDIGDMKINYVAGQVCFDWYNATYPTSGCYTVEQITANKLRLHLVNGKEDIDYNLTR